jgi:hypothetical protein
LNQPVAEFVRRSPYLPGGAYLIVEADVYLHFRLDEGEAPKLGAISKKWDHGAS